MIIEKNIYISISQLLTDQIFSPVNGEMNLGGHDKEFHFESIIGKINSGAGGRQHKLKIKKAKYLENLVKQQLQFTGQKHVMKSEKKIPSIRQTYLY